MCKQCNCQSDQGCSCGCDGGSHCECGGSSGRFERRYQTKAEQIAELEAYHGERKTETQAVEEHLADLRE